MQSEIPIDSPPMELDSVPPTLSSATQPALFHSTPVSSPNIAGSSESQILSPVKPASEVPWPTRILTLTALKKIDQIKYFIRTLSPGAMTFDVFAINTNLNPSTNYPYHWAYFPTCYSSVLARPLFRLELLKIAAKYKVKKGDQLKRDQLRKVHENLVHLDKTLDLIWEEAQQASENHNMGTSWRSCYLDRWLAVEFALQRHEPLDIECFEEEETGNAALLLADPLTLGISSYIFSMIEN